MLGQVIGDSVKQSQDNPGVKNVDRETRDESMYENFDNSMKEVLRQVLGSQYQNCHDSCKCYCPLQGLHTTGHAFERMEIQIGGGTLEIEEEHEIRRPLIDWILKMLAHDLMLLETIELTNSTLRCCLFEDLGLRHICCQPTHWA